MKRTLSLLAAMVLLCLCMAAQATVEIEMVSISYPGLPADPATGYGYVECDYSIGKYEVTVEQYVEFMNWKEIDKSTPLLMSSHGMTQNHINLDGSGTPGDPYHYSVGEGDQHRPITFVKYWDACRFVNWLCNGQGNGDTETGAYTLDSYDGSEGGNIDRNDGAAFYLPTFNEWYKGAYFGPGGIDAISGGDGDIVLPYTSTFGTVNQYGDGWEWTDTYVSAGAVDARMLGGGYVTSGVQVDFRGTAFGDPSRASGPGVGGQPLTEDMGCTFRVASVPEPSSIIALLGGLTGLIALNRRKG